MIGSVSIHNIAGKGRGLVATADVNHGDLLLLCEPIGGAPGVAWAPEGASLRPPDLLALWRSLQATGGTAAAASAGGTGALSAGDCLRLSLLYHGEDADVSAGHKVTLADFNRADVVPKEAPPMKGFGAAPKVPERPAGIALTDERLEQVVALNSWGCEHGDFGVCGVSGVPSRAHIGVWPEFSLVNHSCAPNTVVFTVGSSLVVRAASPIPAGGEVTTSYIGGLGAAPLAKRRHYLQAAYGFECGCPRCATESRQPAEVQAALDAAHAALEERSAALQAAAAGVDPAAVAACLQEAQGHVDAVEAAMDRHQVQPQVRAWLRASVYGWHELLAICRDGQSSASDPALPMGLVPIVEVFAPAGDAHLYLCLEWLTRVGERLGQHHEATQAAAKPCLGAHLRRYGAVSDAMLTRLMTERGKVSYAMGRYDLPGQGHPAGGG